MKRIFVCVVFHHSELRPKGLEAAENFCRSWGESDLPYNLMVLDNSSTCEYECLKGIDHYFLRIDDQIANGGITGAWNTLCKEAIAKNADIIMGFSDDVIVNKSLIKLVEATVDDNVLYVPLTNGVLDPFMKQKSDSIKEGYIKTVGLVNGFWMSFTSKFWWDKQKNTSLFIEDKKASMDKWAGQEHMLQKWAGEFKTKGCIVGDCWIQHDKLRSWKLARGKYG